MLDAADAVTVFRLKGMSSATSQSPHLSQRKGKADIHDPDGNGWLFQEVTTRLPGRVDPTTMTVASPSDLASALRRVAAAHGSTRRGRGKPTRTGRTGTPST